MRDDLPSADVLEQIFHKALSAGDIEGVGHVLRLMVAQDPRRAVELYEELKTGLAVAKMLGVDR